MLYLIASAYDVLDVAQKTGSLIASLSIIFACASYVHQRKALRLQHERARLEKAVAVVADFSKLLTPRSAAARKLAKKLQPNDLEKVDQGQEFEIAREFQDLLIAALPDHVDEQIVNETEGPIRLTRQQSFLLRWEILSFLNSSEAAAQSWLLDVAHRPTIEDELRFLLEKHERGKNILTTFGLLAKLENYPALHSLMDELETQRESPPKQAKIDS